MALGIRRTMSVSRFASFAEFWPYYVRQHASPACRRLHFVGTTAVVGVLIAAAIYSWWLLLLAPVVGYAFAWIGHFAFEHNTPATFGHPLWSLAADWKMWALMLTGRMQAEVDRAIRSV